MHGSGKILFRVGPFYFIKQGFFRGVIYSGIILELFLMSFLLTEGFGEKITIASLKSIKFWEKNRPRKDDKIDFILLVFYVIKLFRITYSKIPIFFKRSKKGEKRKLKARTIMFFEESLRELQKDIINIENISLPDVKFKFGDVLLIALQILIIIFSYLLKTMNVVTI